MNKYIAICVTFCWILVISVNAESRVNNDKSKLKTDTVQTTNLAYVSNPVPNVGQGLPLYLIPDDRKNQNKAKEVTRDMNFVNSPAALDLQAQRALFQHPYGENNQLEKAQDPNAIYGLDVSHYQSRINWDQVRNYQSHRISYVYVKATEGAILNDPYYQKNIEEARRLGIPVGSYHYFSTNVSGRVQFEHFREVVDKEKQDLLPVIDVEERRWTAPTLRANLQEFLDCCEEYYGVKPIIYTGVFFYNTFLAEQFKGYQFFIARYSNNEPTLMDGKDWDIWQFTDRGSVQGINGRVDVSRLNVGVGLDNLRFRKVTHFIKHDKRPNALPGTDLGEVGTGRTMMRP